LENALKAKALMHLDRDYIVKDGEVIIVDEFTGRQMPGRRWSEGLHQAIEAKEGLRVQRESVTLATITFQNYFRLYDKLAGMTGTAMTESEEFYKIYGLDVVAIPTHRPMIRDDEADLVFRSENAKFEAVIDEIEEMHEAGRLVLVGTVTVEKSEILSEMLRRRGVPHEVLNAKFHEKEAEIVAQAGRSGAVTISTNMAGRGTDIVLGGNPAGLASEQLRRQAINPAEAPPEVYEAALKGAQTEAAADHERVVEAGGLHIIGTERHDARRIDNQLRGRSGRQGDPGSSRFYLSLEDPLMKRFASDRVAGMMERLGLDDDTAIESRLVSRTVESAQSRVEGYNFDIRKRVVEFDDVINRQRETIYAERDKVLHNEDLTDTLREFLDDEIDVQLDVHLAAEQADDWDMEGLSKALVAMGLDPAGLSPDDLWEIGGREAIRERLVERMDEALERKQTEIGAENWPLVERLVLLRSIDSLWVEHLTELDDMRRAAGLRGYGGEDPLNAFRKIAFELYEELRGFIRSQVAHTILRVQIQIQPPVQATMPLPGPGQPGNARAENRSGAGASADGTSPTTGAAAAGLGIAAAATTGVSGSGRAVVAAATSTSGSGGGP
ncbi:MAG: preprotein translocase subunit SecA, partial [Candidatus Limnocylindrales bacterium]